MPECQVSRPILLEVGEESRIEARPSERAFLLECDDPAVLEIEGDRIRGRKPGAVRVTARLGDSVRSWDMKVTAPVAGHDRAPVAERPRILFAAGELSEFRDRVEASASERKDGASRQETGIDFPALWKAFVEKADACVREERFQVSYPSVSIVMDVELPLREPETIPNPDGYVDYPFWTMFSRAVEDRLHTLSAVYLVTGQPQYADKARMYLLGLAGFGKWYEFDHRGAEGNLSNAHFVIGASTAFDAVQDRLTAAERRLISDAILHRGLQPLAIDIGNADMHNIVAAKQVAMMYGAAALHGSTPFAAKYMNQAVDYIRSYLDRKLASAETEGLLYDNVAARHIWMAADLYRRVTGDATLCNHPYIKEELPARFFRFLSPGTPNTFPNFSDSFCKLDLSYVMSMLASHHGHPAAMWYLNRFEAQNPSVLLNVRRVPEEREPEAYFGGESSAVFETIGWASLRTGWRADDSLLAFTSGSSSRDHNHKDQNNLMLNVGGEWLLTNPGYQDYVPGPRADYTVGTVGHNALLVNGQGQRIRGGGSLTGSWLTPDWSAVRGDAAASYAGLLQKWSRTTLHVDRSYYVVWDQVELNDEADQAELLFHTTSAIVENGRRLAPGDTLQGAEAVIQGERASVRLLAALPHEPDIRVAEYAGAESYGPHLSVRGRGRAARQTFVTLLCPSTSGERVRLEDSACEADGAACLTIGRGRLQDIVLLPAAEDARNGTATVYAGFRLKGRAAWASVDTDRDGRARLRKAAVWESTEWRGPDDAEIFAELPVSIAVDIATGECRIRNGHHLPVAIRIRLPRQDERAASFVVPPGSHRLTSWTSGNEVHL